MNTSPNKTTGIFNPTDELTFGNARIKKNKVYIGMITLMASLFGMALLVSQPVNNAHMFIDEYINFPTAMMKGSEGINIGTSSDLVHLLKNNNLWEIENITTVPAVLVSRFPENFVLLVDIQTRKRAFLHTLLPAALVALSEIKQERWKLQMIVNKIATLSEALIFSRSMEEWKSVLSDSEIAFVIKIQKKYRSQKADELLARIDVIPVSLILGQGALESSWGGSRFARDANNLFGVWTWGKKGIIPTDRDEGEKHKIRIYDSILESVRSYILMLNRLHAYKSLRELRKITRDSLQIAAGLQLYSERRDAYVQDVKDVISSNNLQRYDKVRLSRVSFDAEGRYNMSPSL